MNAPEPKASPGAAPAPGEQTSESRAAPRPGRNAFAYILGRVFKLWMHLPGTAKANRPQTAAGPVHLVGAADLATAALLYANKTVVCLEPDIASDALAAFLKGCGARVWRPGYQEPAGTPSRDDVVLLPVADTTPTRSATRMAQALLTAARLERPAAMLMVETARSVTLKPGGQFDWRIPLAPVGVHHGPASGHLTTAGARLAASQSLTSPVINAPKSHNVQSSVDHEKPTKPLALRFYSGAMAVLEPALVLYLTMRAKRGKEIWDRLSERRGVATVARQPGRLGWIHAASVGESVSILPLAGHLLSQGYADRLLVTTGTVTSAALMDLRLPENAHHQFAPLDVPRYVQAFLNYWRPEFALFAESEIWPNLLQGLSRQAIPHALLNGRMSTTSFNRWQRYPNVAHATLQSWSVCLAQTREFATRYAALGVPTVAHTGNLKFDSPPLPADPDILDSLRIAINGRPVWLAASTHAGEEEIIAQAHYTLRERCPELLTIIVPRHPERAPDIISMLEDRWLTTARRSIGGKISAKVDVYVADTIGELGLFFRLVEISLIGGSLALSGGGHNPVEPAQLDNAILHGPGVHNFRDMYEIFTAGGGTAVVTSASDLTAQLVSLLFDPNRTRRMATANKTLVRASAGSLQRSLSALRPVIGDPR